MSLTNATVITGGTLSAAGGSSVAYSVYGLSAGKMTIGVSADTDIRLRRTIGLSVVPSRPLASAPNGYTQSRAKAVIKHPILLANGKYTTCSVGIDISFDPEMSSTEKTKMLDTAAQLFFDADFSDFVKNLSLG